MKFFAIIFFILSVNYCFAQRITLNEGQSSHGVEADFIKYELESAFGGGYIWTKGKSDFGLKASYLLKSEAYLLNPYFRYYALSKDKGFNLSLNIEYNKFIRSFSNTHFILPGATAYYKASLSDNLIVPFAGVVYVRSLDTDYGTLGINSGVRMAFTGAERIASVVLSGIVYEESFQLGLTVGCQWVR